MIEIWKDVQGYDGLYQVSSLGRVRRRGRILRPTRQSTGYYYLRIQKRGRKRQYYVHRLVAQAFIPNPLGLPTVNHIDEDKANNRAENLEWMTLGDNVKYSNSKAVRQFRRDGTLVAEYPSMQEAERQTGIDSGNICGVARGKYKTAGGYVWRYAEHGEEDMI